MRTVQNPLNFPGQGSLKQNWAPLKAEGKPAEVFHLALHYSGTKGLN